MVLFKHKVQNIQTLNRFERVRQEIARISANYLEVSEEHGANNKPICKPRNCASGRENLISTSTRVALVPPYSLTAMGPSCLLGRVPMACRTFRKTKPLPMNKARNRTLANVVKAQSSRPSQRSIIVQCPRDLPLPRPAECRPARHKACDNDQGCPCASPQSDLSSVRQDGTLRILQHVLQSLFTICAYHR